MNTFKTKDGDTFKAVSPQEIVEHMRNSSRFASDQDVDEFMRGFAQRFHEWDGTVIRCDTPEIFVEDLLKADYLTQI